MNEIGGLASRRNSRVASALLLVGGLLIAAGALMPWLTMFAGLQVYRGVIGWNGRLVMIGGGIIAVAGVVGIVRGLDVRATRVAAVIAVAEGVFGIFLSVRMIEMWRQLTSHDAMMVARPGIGLPCVVAGAVLAATAFLATRDQPRLAMQATTVAVDSANRVRP